MTVLTCLYISFLGIFNNIDSSGICNLLQHWNKTSLSVLKENAALAVTEQERALYQNRLEAMPGVWEGIDSINYKSIRLLFLEQISTDFNWKDKKWVVIEAVKNGEIKRLVNYLIYYDGSQTSIIEYRYHLDKWIKVQEWQEHLKMVTLFKKKDKVSMDRGSNSGDVIVTSFRSGFPLQSAYFVENTLDQGSMIRNIISR
ncbi:hypothetical protein [Chitinophaga ginsengisegetis]|uniref:hypothetical protein n=1 Tax=Chitinophaga ginsengisegetis TaxID=393003 RepID=UPI000DB9C910|nr:hypothetical protein [Chitinophaga ginsengisegetis]MDR6569837.1 hypothetical protein [Chitinophaga ginsengisegetis]MDR6649570.1 hypothetical protein [Chitinophaga ginsengisegetis]MDR6655920.1 hypothetical protein [Chitinophaga ginsengisegetis]